MSTGFRRRIDSDSLGRQLGPELDDYCFPIGLGQCRVDFDKGLSGLSSGTLGPEMDDYCFPTDDMTTRGGAAQAAPVRGGASQAYGRGLDFCYGGKTGERTGTRIR